MTWTVAVLVAAVPIAMGFVLILTEDNASRRRAGMALCLTGLSLLMVCQARDRNDVIGLILPWLLAGVWAYLVLQPEAEDAPTPDNAPEQDAP